MKKTGKFLLAVALVALFVLPLVGCGLFKSVTPDEAKTNLENAGYAVVLMTGAEYVASDRDTYPTIMEHELDQYLYAEKDDEKIELFFFNTIDYASDNYTFMTSDLPQSGQSNKLVYFATKQAKKDAGM